MHFIIGFAILFLLFVCYPRQMIAVIVAGAILSTVVLAIAK